MAENAPDARKIIVRTQATDGFLRLSVRDFGRGVTPENRDKVFQPFFTTKGTGLGMGLAVSKSIIEAHRGRIWVENNADGGATFIFQIPILDGGGS